MKIGNLEINSDSKIFIIAELSANHNGSLDTALETIRAAKRAGADCIKLQTYTAETITIAPITSPIGRSPSTAAAPAAKGTALAIAF